MTKDNNYLFWSLFDSIPTCQTNAKEYCIYSSGRIRKGQTWHFPLYFQSTFPTQFIQSLTEDCFAIKSYIYFLKDHFHYQIYYQCMHISQISCFVLLLTATTITRVSKFFGVTQLLMAPCLCWVKLNFLFATIYWLNIASHVLCKKLISCC